MTVQLSIALRNARLDEFETIIGTAPLLDLRTGAQPANCAAADSGTELAQLVLPSDWLSAAAAGVKSLLGTWSGTSAAAGTVAHFRIKDSGDTVCHMQGTVTVTAGGGDMEINSVTIVLSQPITVNTFALTDGNA